MKKILLIAMLVTLPLTAVLAQGKLINSSSDKRPVWIKKDVTKYDIMKVSASSDYGVEQAKTAAYDKLRDIAIAHITKYMADISVGEFDINEIKAKVENSQFIKNIDEATSIDTYWEHRRVKNNDVFTYYILYEFNDFEKKKVALELNAKDYKTSFEDNF